MSPKKETQTLIGGPLAGYTFDLDGQAPPSYIHQMGYLYLRSGATTLTWSPKDSPAEVAYQRELAATRAQQQIMAGIR